MCSSQRKMTLATAYLSSATELTSVLLPCKCLGYLPELMTSPWCFSSKWVFLFLSFWLQGKRWEGAGDILQSAEFLDDERKGRACKICSRLAVAQTFQDFSFFSGEKRSFQELQSISQLWFGLQLTAAVKGDSCRRGRKIGQDWL